MLFSLKQILFPFQILLMLSLKFKPNRGFLLRILYLYQSVPVWKEGRRVAGGTRGFLIFPR